MNENIRRLLAQAYLEQADIRDTTKIAEKFAELIVQECIGIADDLMNRNADGTWTSTELYTDYNGALFLVKRRIREHFGVEL
jgi:hypothetical protein